MDRDVRELERRWRASNDPQDEAAWHVARVRAGQLAPERVELAAVLGHEAAALAATTLEPAARPSRGAMKRREAGLPGWSDELPRFGYLPALRAAIALLELLRPVYIAGLRHARRPEPEYEVDLDTLFERGLAALSAFALDPGPPTREAVVAIDEEEQRASSLFIDSVDAMYDGAVAAFTWHVEDVAGPCFGLLETLHTVLDPITMDEEPTRARGWFLAVVRDVSHHAEAPELDVAVRAALIPWALGLADPLRPAG